MHIIEYPENNDYAEICRRPYLDQSELRTAVSDIINAVKENGDAALKTFSQKYDHIMLDNFLVTKQEIERSGDQLSQELKSAIKKAVHNIEKFHQSQLHNEQKIETSPGVWCWRTAVPVEKVGLYIPGGTSPLFSTLLMLGIPAKLAGCAEIVICTPPGKKGQVDPAILFVAHELGLQKIYKVGGAQAIAAMAYGTESIPQVYKIFGPGNQYVTMAKQLVLMDGVAIDMPAGPSEVAVIADNRANPDFIAADLLSQAEHGSDSQVLLITTEKTLIDKVRKSIENQLKNLPRRQFALESLKNSTFVVTENLKQAVALINHYAPEHLILQVENADKIANEIKNAGSVFLGHYTPESAGDYASGTNHTLPTNSFARMYSGVSPDSFMKNITFQHISEKGLRELGPHIQTMARAENLEAHSKSVEIRLNQLKKRD